MSSISHILSTQEIFKARKLQKCSSSYLNDNERHVETIWPPMFGFRLLPTNSDLIIIKKLFRAANFSGAGGDEKLKIIFNWPYMVVKSGVYVYWVKINVKFLRLNFSKRDFSVW